MWLQKNYTFHSRWFLAAALVTSFFVYLRALLLPAHVLLSGLPDLLSSVVLPQVVLPQQEGSVTALLLPSLPSAAVFLLLCALAATGVTALAIWLFVGSRGPG